MKCLLPIREGNVDFDDVIRTHIFIATRQIEQATKRRFTSQSHVQFFAARDTAKATLDLIGDGRSTTMALVNDFHTGGTTTVITPQTLTLQSFPVLSVPAVEVVYDPLGAFAGNASFIIVNASSYQIDEDLGLLYLRFAMRRGRRRIRVTFTGGFAAAGDPGFETLSADLTAQGFEDIKQAAIIQTVFLFKKLDRDNIGKKADRKQGVSGRFGQTSDFLKIGGLCPEAASLLTAYKAIIKGNG